MTEHKNQSDIISKSSSSSKSTSCNKEVELKFRMPSSLSVFEYPKNWDISFEINQYYLNVSSPSSKKTIEELVPCFDSNNWNNIKEVRIRSKSLIINKETTYTLTLKSSGGLSRDEYENQITKQEFDSLLRGYAVSHIHKIRSVLNCSTISPLKEVKDPIVYKELNFEFDVFVVPPSCPDLIEIEFNPEKFSVPELTALAKAHFGSDIVNVTENKFYKNVNLAMVL